MVEVDNLTKAFYDSGRGRVVALDHVSFTAAPGEIFGILGPNGAGKTTALRILSTILKSTEGQARVAGFDVATQPHEVRRHVGYLSSSTGIYDRLTAWEVVEFFAKLHGMAGAKLHGRMEEVFTLLQMNDFRDVTGGKMSTGMKQKVSVARAIVHDPPVLIFDEPTAGLDVLVARSVLDTILRFRELGKCILFSTHIMREVERLCDRVAILHRGQILTLGTLPELLERHVQPDLEELFFALVK